MPLLLLQEWISTSVRLHSDKHDEAVQLYAFDILALDDEDLSGLPLSLRKTNFRSPDMGYHKMSGSGADQRAVAVPGSAGEPGKASPMRGGGRMVKRMRRCEPGKTVAV
jgi:hypothetical protein